MNKITRSIRLEEFKSRFPGLIPYLNEDGGREDAIGNDYDKIPVLSKCNWGKLPLDIVIREEDVRLVNEEETGFIIPSYFINKKDKSIVSNIKRSEIKDYLSILSYNDGNMRYNKLLKIYDSSIILSLVNVDKKEYKIIERDFLEDENVIFIDKNKKNYLLKN